MWKAYPSVEGYPTVGDDTGPVFRTVCRGYTAEKMATDLAALLNAHDAAGSVEVGKELAKKNEAVVEDEPKDAPVAEPVPEEKLEPVPEPIPEASGLFAPKKTSKKKSKKS